MCGYILLRLRLLSFILRYRTEVGVPFRRNPLLSSSSSVPPLHPLKTYWPHAISHFLSLLPFSAWQRKGVVGKGKGQTHALTNPSQERWKREKGVMLLTHCSNMTKRREKGKDIKGSCNPKRILLLSIPLACLSMSCLFKGGKHMME